MQPVFQQTVYLSVFTVLCTVLSSLIVLFIAVLYWSYLELLAPEFYI
jgi:hypothetical protein